MAPHSSTVAWKIPWTEKPGRLQSMGSLRVRHDPATSLSLSTFMHWRRKWQPTPVFLPGESHGQGSLVGCSPWGRTESDTTESMQQQQASLSITNSCSLPKLMSTESVMPSNHLILCHPLLPHPIPLLSPPSVFPSIRVFSNESVLRIRWPKYWSFSCSISPSNEHPGLIFFRMDWLALLAVQGTLKSLLQHHSSKASILWCSAFFIVQL